MIPLWRDENHDLAVTIYADASADIRDKHTDTHWRMGRVALQEEGSVDIGHVWLRTTRSICEQYPGRFRGEAIGNTLRFALLGREGRTVGQFTCRVRLDGPWLELQIGDIDETLPSLVFPPPIESESLVLPTNVGRWVRSPLAERHIWAYPGHLNMRWFGGLRGDNGWMAILHEGAPDSGVLATELAVAPLWFKSLGRWAEPRTLRYRFTSGGYVGLAKAFRAYAIEHGLHRPLTEKIAEIPAAGDLRGGRILAMMQAYGVRPERYEDQLRPVPDELTEAKLPVAITHADAARVIAQARELGMRRGLVVLRGWINGGYDERHPDVWPPEPALGTTDELSHIVGDKVFPVALHDNYQDIYQQSPSWPHGVIRLPNGDPMPGGIWAGGQAYILNPRNGFAYAQRNWEQIQTLGPRAMFIDTTIAPQLYQSYEPGNTLTRAQDLELKLELLRFYKQHGLTLGSEEGADYGVPLVDWIENRHRRVAGESIPLWPLVYHDAAFCARYKHAPHTPPAGAPHWLADMLWGYPLLWDVRDLAVWARDQTDFAATTHVDNWHQHIGLDEMLSHRYLTEDGEVEQAIFTNGEIVANFTPEPCTVDGVSVPGYGYVIRG
jgi:hypothetical protein